MNTTHKWVVFIVFTLNIGISYGQTPKTLIFNWQSGFHGNNFSSQLGVYISLKKSINNMPASSYISTKIYLNLPTNNSERVSYYIWPNLSFTHFFLRPKNREFNSLEGLYFSATSIFAFKSIKFRNPYNSILTNWFVIGLYQKIYKRISMNMEIGILFNYFFSGFTTIFLTPLDFSALKFCYEIPIKF